MNKYNIPQDILDYFDKLKCVVCQAKMPEVNIGSYNTEINYYCSCSCRNYTHYVTYISNKQNQYSDWIFFYKEKYNIFLNYFTRKTYVYSNHKNMPSITIDSIIFDITNFNKKEWLEKLKLMYFLQ